MKSFTLTPDSDGISIDWNRMTAEFKINQRNAFFTLLKELQRLRLDVTATQSGEVIRCCSSNKAHFELYIKITRRLKIAVVEKKKAMSISR